jgi:hypothetical protein
MDPGLHALLQIAIPFLIFMAGLIYYFACYQKRIRPPSADYFQEPSGDWVRIDCTQRALTEFAWRNKWLSLIPSIFIGLVSLIILMVGVSSGVEFSELLDPGSRFFRLFLIIMALTGIGAFLGYQLKKPQLLRQKKAYQLSSRHDLVFEANSESLRIPTLLLMNPPFWRATDKGLYEILIPLSDVERFEVRPRMGNSPAGFKIVPRGQSIEWGKGQLGNSDVLQFGIGIRRDLFTPLEQQSLLSFLRGKLGDRLIIRDQL